MSESQSLIRKMRGSLLTPSGISVVWMGSGVLACIGVLLLMHAGRTTGRDVFRSWHTQNLPVVEVRSPAGSTLYHALCGFQSERNRPTPNHVQPRTLPHKPQKQILWGSSAYVGPEKGGCCLRHVKVRCKLPSTSHISEAIV